MKYIINETPLKTTNNFKINNLKIDIDIEEETINDLIINTKEINKLNIKATIKDNFNSKIGLSHKKYKSIEIDVLDTVNNPVNISYDFTKSKYLVSEIIINLKENTKSSFIINLNSKEKVFNNTKIIVQANNYSKSNITFINLLDKESINIISFENYLKESSEITHNFIDLGSNVKISNYYSELSGDNSKNYLNNMFFGSNNERIDMNYHMKSIGKRTNSNILVQGALDDNCIKSFKGTIDFIEGCTKSNGEENENCILLSNTSKSRSLPMLLCHEEDVTGSHGVSTGKIDITKLFYLMAKGISEEDAKKLILYANYQQVINNINDKETREKIVEEINKRI
ncbi:MAG: SufD family Fe-S cluster assembly protein [Bacilli bacterium]|nr:SufD family Fe-S cluster assembly protein [Bacilli bacterium]